MIHPLPTTWFEILAAGDDAALALEALAETGAAELEARPGAQARMGLAEIVQLLERYAELSRQYQPYWPPAAHRRAPAPATGLAAALQRIEAWAAEAEALIGRMQRLEAERAELLLWQRLFARLGGCGLDFAALSAAGPILQASLLMLPKDRVPEIPPSVLTRRFDIDGALHLIALGDAPQIRALCRQVAALDGRTVAFPAWLRAAPRDNAVHIVRRSAALEERSAKLQRLLQSLHREHRLADALETVRRLEWFAGQANRLQAGGVFVWISGWTSDTGKLRGALRRCGARALVHFPDPPAAVDPPLVLRNPRWARPFEPFSRALGMPGSDEVDPSRLLALAMPLMFGYMFGDLGQGLVLVIAGLALERRYPMARLLLAGGFSAMIFGMLFGSAFSRGDLLPALWIHPLDDPVLLLLVPLAGGAVLLALGMLLTGLEAYWRKDLGRWLLRDAGSVAVYLGIFAGLLFPQGYVFAAIGLLAHVGGRAWSERRLRAAVAALAYLFETLQRTLVNTLSFARIGAFALAHAGLSTAISALAEAAGGPVGRFGVLLAGNALVIGVEALVVSIQTTRLVLFEFFTRFLQGGGRGFRPLSPPPGAGPGELHESTD